MDRNQGHAKSVSPTKEVIWRRSPLQNPGIFRRGSETTKHRLFASFGEDTALDDPFESPMSARRWNYQKQRHSSSTLQDFHREQAGILESRRLYSRSNQPPPAPSSYFAYDASGNRHSAVEPIMHSSDSLSSRERTSSGGSKMDNQQYAQGQFASSPPRTSQMDFQHVQNRMSSPIMTRREVPNPPPQIPQTVPYQPQMLVDPNTGQHYILPHAQPQYFYPLMPAPMYYQPSVPPGYVVASQAQPVPQPPQSPTHSRAVFFRPQQFQNNFNGYFVEHPPSSNVSLCGQQDSEYFSKNLGSRQSLESGSSGKTPERKNSRDSVSPCTQNQNTVNQTTFAQLKNETSPPGKFSTTSSCTSGFGSGPGECTVEGNIFNNFSNKSKPVWWGTSETSTRIGLDDNCKISPTRLISEIRNSTVNENEEKNEKILKPIQKSIRMDIDLNSPVNLELEEKKIQKSSISTAFTVTFDEESKQLSLQEAAKQVPRRFMKRQNPPKNVNSQTDSENEQDPKHYLFKKMIQGVKNCPTSPLALSTENQEFDTLSEAGTYVVDTKSRMEESQILDSEHESSSDETESTVSKPSTSAKPPADPSAPEVSKNRSLLAQRLDELRKRTNIQISTKSTDKGEKKDQISSRLCQRHSHTPSSTTNNPNFRRGDGGRFSMRTPTSPCAPTSRPAVRPPFKAGSAAPKKPQMQVPQKDNPEMAAWLRRKEYDPRKSAAEAKKIQQLKAREKIFQQNRSISFHPGSGSGLTPNPKDHHKSHDNLSHVDEEEPRPSSDLERQVDALTQKCLKSIQLIKLCNQNTLSDSVENLLDRVVATEDNEEVRETEPVAEQLKRLSSAFDAIQKYFEEQRSSSASPPIFRRLESLPVESPRLPGSKHIPPESDH